MRQSGDQIDIYVGQADFPQELNVTLDGFGGMAASGLAQFFRDKRLNAEADAVDSALAPLFGGLMSDSSRRAFEGCFCDVALGECLHKRAQQGSRHQTGSAAAEIDGFRIPLPAMCLDLVQ